MLALSSLDVNQNTFSKVIKSDRYGLWQNYLDEIKKILNSENYLRQQEGKASVPFSAAGNRTYTWLEAKIRHIFPPLRVVRWATVQTRAVSWARSGKWARIQDQRPDTETALIEPGGFTRRTTSRRMFNYSRPVIFSQIGPLSFASYHTKANERTETN